MFSGNCAAGEKPDFKGEHARLSYSIGYQVGGDFLRQGQSVDPELVLKGVQDALTGIDPLINSVEMRRILMDLRKDLARQEAGKGGKLTVRP